MKPTCTLLDDPEYFELFKASEKAFWIEPAETLLPDNAEEIVEQLQQFRAREDDVYVATHPKTGTALAQEIVLLLTNATNIQSANSQIRSTNFPYLEVQVWPKAKHLADGFAVVETLPSPRLIKTHVPYLLMPPDALNKKCKIIYVARNIKDVVVSYFYFMRDLPTAQFQGTFDKFASMFIENRVPYASYVKHAESFWERRHDSNVLFLTYEDMKKDLKVIIQQIASFLNKKVTAEEIDVIVDHCRFDKMKKNPAVNMSSDGDSKGAKEGFQYLRKGIVGDWKNHFSDAMVERYEECIRKTVKDPELANILRGSC